MRDAQREFLSFEEVQKLASTECSLPNLKRAFLFSCYTGLRFSDIRNLKWDNIKDGHIELQIQKTKDFEHIPLSETANSILHLVQGNVFPIALKSIFDIPKRGHANVVLKKMVRRCENREAHFLPLCATYFCHPYSDSRRRYLYRVEAVRA